MWSNNANSSHERNQTDGLLVLQKNQQISYFLWTTKKLRDNNIDSSKVIVISLLIDI